MFHSNARLVNLNSFYDLWTLFRIQVRRIPKWNEYRLTSWISGVSYVKCLYEVLLFMIKLGHFCRCTSTLFCVRISPSTLILGKVFLHQEKSVNKNLIDPGTALSLQNFLTNLLGSVYLSCIFHFTLLSKQRIWVPISVLENYIW